MDSDFGCFMRYWSKKLCFRLKCCLDREVIFVIRFVIIEILFSLFYIKFDIGFYEYGVSIIIQNWLRIYLSVFFVN